MKSTDLSNVLVLEYYGADNPPEGPGWKNMLCPFHEEKNPSARSNGKGFICMGCGVKGDALALLMERENIGYHASLELYESITGYECNALREATSGRRRPFSDQLSDGPRDYERHSTIFSAGTGKRSPARIRPRLSGG